MDEFSNKDMMSDSFGFDPFMVGTVAVAGGVVWYGHRKRWWHHLWPFGRHVRGPVPVMTRAAVEESTASGPRPYMDELMSVETRGGYIVEGATPSSDEHSGVVREVTEETVDITETDSVYVESHPDARRPAPPLAGRPAPPRGRPAPPRLVR